MGVVVGGILSKILGSSLLVRGKEITLDVVEKDFVAVINLFVIAIETGDSDV